VTLLAFGLGALFIAFALYIPTRQKLDIANADLDSATLRRMSLQLQVREGVNGWFSR